MSQNVFLAPCDSGNFDRTVRSAIDVTDYDDVPEALSNGDSIRFWGVENGSNTESTFEKMESGDLVLFYRDGEYVGTGWIGTTVEDGDEWASASVWDDSESTLLYTVEEFSPVSVPKAAVNRIFDYSDGYNPHGLMRVSPRKVDKQPAAIKLALEKYTEQHS